MDQLQAGVKEAQRKLARNSCFPSRSRTHHCCCNVKRKHAGMTKKETCVNMHEMVSEHLTSVEGVFVHTACIVHILMALPVQSLDTPSTCATHALGGK